MFAYWIIPVLSSWLALYEIKTHGYSTHQSRRVKKLAWKILFLITVIFIGFRHEVGGDWITYVIHVEAVQELSILEALDGKDPAYGLLNWVGANIGGGVYFTNIVCSIIFTWGLFNFCKLLPRPSLALMAASPYLITVVAMGYTRQGVAIGIVMLGLAYFFRTGRLWGFMAWITLAATFHKTSIIVLPLLILASTKSGFLSKIGITAVGFFVFSIFLEDSLDYFQNNYVAAEYSSSGAGIRIAMNAVPAIFFILFFKKFKINSVERNFWLICSVTALVLIYILINTPSSTAIDRLALYLIPLQLFVWSHLPSLFDKKFSYLIVCALIIYSLLILFVWLVFAANSFAWLPYKFYPWHAIWN